jgi:hypothetical protein
MLPAMLSTVSPGAHNAEVTQRLVRPMPTAPPGTPGRYGEKTRQKVIKPAVVGERSARVSPAGVRPAVEGHPVPDGQVAPAGYADDVTMKLRPRRRRVSGDGLLEELV